MKKLYVISALVLWGIVQTVSAQNMYRNYYSNTIPRPTSAVSVVHSNGYVYFFQADGNGKISISEIDPLSMNPTGNDVIYDITGQNFGFNVNGGFEDANGNFVLFGNTNNSNPALVVITSNLSACSAYYWGISWSFFAGCSGYDTVGDEVYLFVNNGELLAVKAANPFMSSRIYSNLSLQDNYTDISWDGINSQFIATGSARNTPTGHEDPFVEVFKLHYDPASTIYNIIPITEYYICDPALVQANEYKSLHVQTDDKNLILYHDLRLYGTPNAYDMIWLTRIRNFYDYTTAIVDESWVYQLPNTKLSAKDMLYDPFNKRLNFLGYYNHCMEGLTQILAQADPYSLSSGIHIAQLGATFLGGSCPNYQPPYNAVTYHNDLEMFNLALNQYNPCNSVLIAGVEKWSVLTETYDISLSSCDKSMWHNDFQANAKPFLYPLNPLPQLISPSFLSVSIFSDSIAVNKVCDEANACSHQFGGKSLQQSVSGNTPTAEIRIEPDKLFVCEGFEGDIHYSLYDMAGKLLQQGITRNGKQNRLKKSNGIYLLRAIDSTGNQLIKKVVVL